MKPQNTRYFVRLLGTRPDWPDNMTEKEEKIMNDHYLYLKNLVARNKVLMAGPCFDPVFGLIILNVESEQEAREIMGNEPSVVSGVHTFEMNPMKVSLMADNRPKNRYVTDPSDRILRKVFTVKAPLDAVWKTWTTTKGVESFFADNALVELYPGGPFEILFNSSVPYGMQGSEDCKILSFVPKEILCFEWNAPPNFGDIRYVKTIVTMIFMETGSGEVEISFSQYGWGKSEKWDELYEYFDQAWSWAFDNFEKSLENNNS